MKLSTVPTGKATDPFAGIVTVFVALFIRNVWPASVNAGVKAALVSFEVMSVPDILTLLVSSTTMPVVLINLPVVLSYLGKVFAVLDDPVVPTIF